jgi:hypothetical protein
MKSMAGGSMKRVLELMDQKNHYLEKFYSVNESALEYFLKDQFDTLNEFYQSRENILEILKYIDNELNVVSHQVREENVLDIQKLKEALKIKDTYVEKIIEQDINILSCIEAAKNSIIKELKEVRKGQKIVSAYKVPQFSAKLEEEV